MRYGFSSESGLYARRRVMDALKKGPAAALEAFLDEMASLARLHARGTVAKKILPACLTVNGSVTSSVGEVTEFGADEFRNGTQFDFVALAVIPSLFSDADGTGQRQAAANTDFAVRDRDIEEWIIGGPRRVSGLFFIDTNGAPTRVCYFPGDEFQILGGHVIKPGGGLIVEAENGGSADDIEIAVPGYWVEEW